MHRNQFTRATNDGWMRVTIKDNKLFASHIGGDWRHLGSLLLRCVDMYIDVIYCSQLVHMFSFLMPILYVHVRVAGFGSRDGVYLLVLVELLKKHKVQRVVATRGRVALASPFITCALSSRVPFSFVIFAPPFVRWRTSTSF